MFKEPAGLSSELLRYSHGIWQLKLYQRKTFCGCGWGDFRLRIINRVLKL
jgi:hypothetical protein